MVAFPRQRLGQYLRVGHAHRQLEFLYKSGRIEVRRAVFEAVLINRQVEFRRDLSNAGVELILDTRDSRRIDRMSILFENEVASSANFQRVNEPVPRKASNALRSGRA